VAADNKATIRTLSISGSGGGSAGIAASIAYSKIGTHGTDADALGADEDGADTQAESETRVADALVLAEASADRSDLFTVASGDHTLARITLGTGGSLDAGGGVAVTATDNSSIESLSGSAAGGSVGVGAAFSIN